MTERPTDDPPKLGIWASTKFVNVTRLRPLLTVALHTAFLSSTLAVGAFVSLGAAFFPVVNKTELLLQLLFYSAAVSLLLRSAWHLLALHVHQQLALMEFFPENQKRIFNSQPAKWIRRITLFAPNGVPRRKIIATLYVLGVVLVAALAWWAALTLGILPHLMYLAGPSGLILWALMFAVVSGSAALIDLYLAPEEARRPQMAKAMLFFAYLTATAGTFGLGYRWIEWHRDLAPRVMLSIVSTSSEARTLSAAIVAAANDGVIAFVDGEPNARLIPWSRIVEIEVPAPDWAVAQVREDGILPP